MDKDEFIKKIIAFDLPNFLEKEFTKKEKTRKELGKMYVERFLVWLRDKHGK
jgi:hypothetical protein